MEPVFSVITVHFNQLASLKSTVSNVLMQKGFGEFIEYIIVDGLSSDGSIDFLHSLQFEKSIHKIVGKDKGLYDAMNKGITKASGKYCIFMNAGDQFASEDLLFRILSETPDADIIYGDTEISYPEYNRTALARPLSNFWKSLPFVHQSVLVKTDLLKTHPFDLHYRYCADYAQLARLYSEGKEFHYRSECFSIITAGGTSDLNRTAATREVFSLSKSIFKIGAVKKLNFRIRILWGGLVSRLKKILPSKVTGKLTRTKYALKK